MAVSWRPLLSLLVVIVLIILDDWLATPSCKSVLNIDLDEPIGDHPEDLKVMVVANLLLLGSEASFVNIFFRDQYISKSFKKSFQRLKPDMLLVLGDVSSRGSELSESEWRSVLHQFYHVLGPFQDLPLHVILGDRDIGECGELNSESVSLIADRFPGLDSAGCGAFEISNISFVSLNAVALLCGNNELRFSVERLIERESLDLRSETEEVTDVSIKSRKSNLVLNGYGWRSNAISDGSGPVLLLHFPLRKIATESYGGSSYMLDGRGAIGPGPYKLKHILPANATEYIFQALKPRMVFSAHSHEFSVHFHSDGICEVTVPAMTWNAKGDPGFVFAVFRRNKIDVSVSYCSLASESGVIRAYIYILTLLLLTIVFPRTTPHLGPRE